MKQIIKFIKNEKAISYIGLLSICFSIIYIFTNRIVEPFLYGKEIMDFFFSLFISIIAAIIFYIFQVYIPEERKKITIRKKIDFEIFEIYSKMFSFFDLVMREVEYSPSSYQEKIRSEKISKRDIELGLQNKCLNQSYFYDENIKGKLLPIGKKISENIGKVNNSIERIFIFYEYLELKEINILEEIRQNFNAYGIIDNWDKNANIKVGQLLGYVRNPSLSNLSKIIYEYYNLFIKLQKIVFFNNLSNREICIYKIQYLFFKKEYKNTIKEIEICKNNNFENINLLEYYKFQSEYYLGNKEDAYKLLNNIFENRIEEELISNRNSIKDFLGDNSIVKIIKQYFSQSEYLRLKTIIEKENDKEKQFIENATYLEEYYKSIK